MEKKTKEEILEYAYEVIKSNQDSSHDAIDPVLLNAMQSYSDQENEALRIENERLREALEQVRGMKMKPNEGDSRYAFNRCYHIADKALNKL